MVKTTSDFRDNTKILSILRGETIMTKPLMLTDNPDYYRTYFIRNNPIKHHARCQTRICVEAREANRVATRNRYGNFMYCSVCETTFQSTLDKNRCPCCSHIMRKRSKYAKTKEQQVVRY